MGAAKTIDPTSIAAERRRPDVERILAVLRDPRYTFDMSLIDEMCRYIAGAQRDQNRSAAQYRTDEDLQCIGQDMAEVQRLRSRVMEIKTKHRYVQKSLRRLWDVGAAVLRSGPINGLSNAEARNAAIIWVLEDLRKRIDDVDTLVETAEDADRHLNNAYYTLKELAAITISYIEGRRHDRA